MNVFYVWVLLSVHTSPHGQLIREYQSTFNSQAKCTVAMAGMNQSDPARSWYCEKHIVE